MTTAQLSMLQGGLIAWGLILSVSTTRTELGLLQKFPGSASVMAGVGALVTGYILWIAYYVWTSL